MLRLRFGKIGTLSFNGVGAEAASRPSFLVDKTTLMGVWYEHSPLSLLAIPWISYTIDDGYVYIASFQPMGRFSDFSATGK
jgi:hypothetical protein